MRRISIEAVSLDTAQGFCSALAPFSPQLLEEATGGYRVQVSVASEEQIVELLDALRLHVTTGDCGPAPVEMDGVRYMLHAD